MPLSGLSPRVRGSPPSLCTGAGMHGSIPACAGKPASVGSAAATLRVYPRVCGEASRRRRSLSSSRGLSPRVRGSLSAAPLALQLPGSIPACAGKPSWRRSSRSARGVYPRVCGEAGCPWIHPRRKEGLSPRVRGSPAGDRPQADRDGSIPACAGKPGAERANKTGRRVYPRVCGEAVRLPALLHRHAGLSPRVRGSPDRRRAGHARRGSIPACAGKPHRRREHVDPGGVYPRVCGEATDPILGDTVVQGLSPRVRGSHAGGGRRMVAPGSIPACAGKPIPRRRRQDPVGVYPRVCGEARCA